MKLISSFLLSMIFLVFTGCSDDNPDEFPYPDEKPTSEGRTLIIYQNAQNSLGYDQYHKNDSAEIVKGAPYMNKNDRILLYMDDKQNPRIYLITQTTVIPKCIYYSQSDADSSSPTTLYNVLNWCKTNYPAQSYGLVLWSHADGWLPPISPSTTHSSNSQASPSSFGIDVGTDGNMQYDLDYNGNIGSQMSIEDLAKALIQSGIHFDYMFFDACAMQCIECCYTLRHATDYIIAGPIMMPAVGANYQKLIKEGFFTDDPSDIARTYYQYMAHEAPFPYDDYGVVISSIKTDGLDSLARLTAEILPQSDGKSYPNMNNAQAYACYISSYGYAPEFYDAGQVMQRILTSSVDSATNYRRWETQLKHCIAYKAATPSIFSHYTITGNEIFIDINQDNYCAASMFVPQKKYTANAPNCRYGDLNEAFRNTEWYRDAGWQQKGW